nr:replication protein [human papillomavirus 35]
MADPAGTDEGEGTGCNGWFFVEAVVSRRTGSSVEDENEDDCDRGEDMVDFINDTDILNIQAETETAQALFHAQEEQTHKEAVQVLKRKYASSPLSSVSLCVNNNISPRLKAICIENKNTAAKRRLFELPDSGYGNSEVEIHEIQQVEGHDTVEQCSMGSGDSITSSSDERHDETPTRDIIQILKCSNANAAMLAKFKELFGISFTELIRPFKSDKSTCTDWCVAAFGIAPSVANFKHITYVYIYNVYRVHGAMVILALLRFKVEKREQQLKTIDAKLLCISAASMLIQPPKLRSTPAALYWFKTAMSNISEVDGETPEWIQRQTVLQHSFNDAIFDLSEMVQWAYDNDFIDDSDIAYKYAQLAETNSNACAFLKSNSQAKIVKDCATMCRHYKRAEKREMTMSQWIKRRCAQVDDDGDWRDIVRFLRYQQVDFVAFLSALKNFLHGVPKKNCILIYGAPNTGKSLFGMSLMHFLQGAIISYVNSKSHFWLQPLYDAKIAMLDDATSPCGIYRPIFKKCTRWKSYISFRCKALSIVHIMPTFTYYININAGKDDRWPYLHSRVVVFTFHNEFPFDKNGNPEYGLNDKNWKSFFSRTWCRLNLHEEEVKENDGDAFPAFKCVSGQNTRTLRD